MQEKVSVAPWSPQDQGNYHTGKKWQQKISQEGNLAVANQCREDGSGSLSLCIRIGKRQKGLLYQDTNEIQKCNEEETTSTDLSSLCQRREHHWGKGSWEMKHANWRYVGQV